MSEGAAAGSAIRRWEDDGGRPEPARRRDRSRRPTKRLRPAGGGRQREEHEPEGERRPAPPSSVCFLGSYPPRPGGIATFTSDLCGAIGETEPVPACSVLAMDDGSTAYAYPPVVSGSIEQRSLIAYHRAADDLNAGSTEVICVQHARALFGGVAGGFLLALLRRLKMPIVTTLHEVAPSPAPAERAVMRELCDLSERVVVKSEGSAEILHRVHRVPRVKIDVIAHGVSAETSRSEPSPGVDEPAEATNWPRVARGYLDSFRQAAATHAERVRALPEEIPAPSTLPPRIDLSHLRAMTDRTGLLQRATFSVPRYRAGYALDDNARALLLLARRNEIGQHPFRNRGLATRYLSFVDHAFDPDTGRFRSVMDYSRQWVDAAHSEDSHGRALWALGAVAGSRFTSGHRDLARVLFERALPITLTFDEPRAWAYCLLGLDARLGDGRKPSRTQNTVRRELAQRLYARFEEARSESWPWGEDTLTHSNARLPEALIASGIGLRDEAMVKVGLRSLRWLGQVQTGPSGMFAPVSENASASLGEEAALGQRPVEACAMVSACLLAYRTTGEQTWLQRAMLAFDWFLGRNRLGRSLYDEQTGGCRDGIRADQLDENQGAEATLSFLMALVQVRENRHRAPASALESEG